MISLFNTWMLSKIRFYIHNYICWFSEVYVYLLLQLAMGKMMDQGPVLIITFQAQLVMVIRNTKGEVVEGDPVSNTHFCRIYAM